MEQYSRKIFAPAVSGAQYETKWFYERARGQYLQAQMRMTPAKKKQFILQHPKEKVITKTDLAKYRNTWNLLPHVVSKGAQTNFMKFAEVIDNEWGENDIRFNEKYFQESVALAILFKHTERLVSKQHWYEQGYRANIVTYSIALLHLLIKKQYKGKVLDLMLIWNKQEVPELVTEALETITEQVFLRITDENRPTVNVTQWCKRESCWQGVSELEILLEAEIEQLLITRVQEKAAEKEARKERKFISGTEAQIKVLEITAVLWGEIHRFAKDKNYVTAEEETALKIAEKIPAKLPNSYQCQKLIGVLDRVQTEGFIL